MADTSSLYFSVHVKVLRSCLWWSLCVLCVFSSSAQQYNVTADSTLSRKRKIGNGEDASAAKKPKEEDSDVAEDAGEGDGVCIVIAAWCAKASLA